MVEVIGKTDKEKDLERKVINLEKITKQAIKDKGKFFNFVSRDKSLIYIHNYNIFTWFMSYSVNCVSNSIKIDKFKHFDFAFELANRYEKDTGQKWTLKTNY